MGDPTQTETTVGYEPDDISPNFLVAIAIGLTIAVIGMVTFTVMYFDSTLADELVAKGYNERIEGAAPRGEWQR